jgi:hypothetical protein
VTPDDTVYYKHETRFDNGQLVDLDERRRVVDKFIMSDRKYHDFLRHAFAGMRKGEICFLKLGVEAHKRMYHSVDLNQVRNEAEREQIRNSIGPDIYMKISVTNIKRDLMCDGKATWQEKIAFYG